jgi:protein-S-isoprenylcysteine O-methyltransferase Ste14
MPLLEGDSTDRPSHIAWPPLLLFSLAATAVVLGYVLPLPWPGIDDTPAHYIGLAFGAAGMVLLIWAIATLNRHDTTVRPDQGATTLVTSGPYRRFRNPLYLANCLIFFGIAEVTKNVWFVIAAIAFVPLVTWLAILPEERHLERRFGAEFLAYKAKSRRWF